MSPRRRSLAVLMIGSVLIQAVTFLLRPASTYRALELDVPGAALGAIGATFAIAPLLLAVPAGALTDRLGPARLVRGGAVIVLASALVLLTASGSVAGLVAGNALLGVGHLACIVGQQTAVSADAEGHRLDAIFGYYTFAASLGQATGPALIALIGGSAVSPDTRPIFLVATGLAGALLVSSLLVPGRPARSRAEHAERTPARRLLRTPGLVRAVTTGALVLSAVDLTLVYLPALGAERDLSATTVGALLTVRAVASMTSRLLVGRLTTLVGRTRLLVGSIVLSVLSLGALTIPMPTWLLLAVVALTGLGLGFGQPLTMSWVAEQAPPGQRGTALALRLAGNRVGQVAVPSGLGLLIGGSSAAGVLGGMAVVLAGTLWLVRGVDLD